MNDDLDFEYGTGTEAQWGCGVSLKGQFWYLGGFSNKRQVKKHIKFKHNFTIFKMSKIIGCQLVAQPDLPFNFYAGACNTFRPSDEKALMCFDYTIYKKCHM